eukprot:3940647-Rhodomonas_salina.1
MVYGLGSRVQGLGSRVPVPERFSQKASSAWHAPSCTFGSFSWYTRTPSSVLGGWYYRARNSVQHPWYSRARVSVLQARVAPDSASVGGTGQCIGQHGGGTRPCIGRA